jgi:phage terminase small subunit
MPNGVKTPEQTVAEFRAHYLYSGNASESAKEVGLPESTGRDLARELSKEPDFVEARRELRALALEELVAMRMRMARRALERFEEDLQMPESVGEGGTVTIIDKRADYGRLVAEAEKNAHNLAKFDAEKEGHVGRPTEVTVVVARLGKPSEPEPEENGD